MINEYWVCFIALSLAIALGGAERQASPGVWGGEHIGLWVDQKGARVEYDCARGVIDEPLRLDAKGRFEARGTHRRESGGPARPDGELDETGKSQPSGQPARYTGRVVGKKMTLTVTLVETGEHVGTFSLAHEREPRLNKCL
jgi:hypothetical protein